MKEVEFNLLEEPWIRVLCPDCTVQEVSLTQALLHAQKYTDLAGELPTQDAAVLRLLLAVLHAVFGRVDADGQPVEITDVTTATRQWKELWQRGRFPEQPVLEYLQRWHDRFWLFHPEYPFWQVPQAKIGIEFDSSKLNGEISQSGNTERLFSSFCGAEKERLSYAAAARWLLYINGYDERGGRPKAGNKPRHGVAWLAQIGFIAVKGKTLFETLMRNFVLLQDGEKCWGKPIPIWEQETLKTEQSTEIPQPDNQAQMLTMQSRRIILKRENDQVVGHILVGGDYIKSENAFSEQMTIWCKVTTNDLATYFPRQHDFTKQMWRELPTFFEGREPGVIRWNMLLQLRSIVRRQEPIVLWNVANQYDSQGASVKDTYSDTLALHLAVFDDLGYKRKFVLEEIHRCEQVAGTIGMLAKDLALAAGSHSETSQTMREQFYFLIDQPFRRWLYSLDPEWDTDEAEESVQQWQEQVQGIARDLGRQMAAQAGTKAFVGRNVEDKTKKKKEKMYCASPKAYSSFLARLRKIYPKEGNL